MLDAVAHPDGTHILPWALATSHADCRLRLLPGVLTLWRGLGLHATEPCRGRTARLLRLELVAQRDAEQELMRRIREAVRAWDVRVVDRRHAGAIARALLVHGLRVHVGARRQ